MSRSNRTPTSIILVAAMLFVTCCGDAGSAKVARKSAIEYKASGIDYSTLEEICVNKKIEVLDISDSPQLRGLDINCIEGLTELRKLFLTDCGVSDVGAPSIGSAQGLTFLNLRGSTMSDVGVKHIANLKNLEQLHLSYNDYITDDGVRHLATLTKLRILVLDHTVNITDGSIRYFKQMSSLKYLRINGTGVSPEGAERLRSAGLDVSHR